MDDKDVENPLIPKGVICGNIVVTLHGREYICVSRPHEEEDRKHNHFNIIRFPNRKQENNYGNKEAASGSSRG